MTVRLSAWTGSTVLTLNMADQGMTPMLSKFWMPLGTFTEQVMEGLKRGDTQIAPGTSGENWERFEKGKLERII